MKLSQKKIVVFQKNILDWYKKHKRDLPWRDAPSGASFQDGIDTSLQERAYRVWISEVMSQQTQINRVIPKFKSWMKKFPTIEALAKAKVSEVLAYWSGLGYNRRALNLKRAAEMIVNDFDSTFPQTEKELLSLPGIGNYTARAILCFAFDQQVAVVDTNVRKVIVTQFGFDGNERALQEIAEQLLPKENAADWNQALMDYAAAVLKKEKVVIPKQSTFIGSHRYYRGQILKLLLAKKKIAVGDIGRQIKKDYTVTQEKWLQRLIKELQDEGFIILKKKIIQLAS